MRPAPPSRKAWLPVVAWRLLRTLPALAQLKLGGDQQYGVDVIRRALEEPLRQMAQNGGAVGAVVVKKVRQGTGAYGYNVASSTYEDLIVAGHHRSDKGRADRAAKRGVGRRADADHRSVGRPAVQKQKRGGWRGWARRRLAGQQ